MCKRDLYVKSVGKMSLMSALPVYLKNVNIQQLQVQGDQQGLLIKLTNQIQPQILERLLRTGWLWFLFFFFFCTYPFFAVKT